MPHRAYELHLFLAWANHQKHLFFTLIFFFLLLTDEIFVAWRSYCRKAQGFTCDWLVLNETFSVSGDFLSEWDFRGFTFPLGDAKWKTPPTPFLGRAVMSPWPCDLSNLPPQPRTCALRTLALPPMTRLGALPPYLLWTRSWPHRWGLSWMCWRQTTVSGTRNILWLWQFMLHSGMEFK